ncbi:hypothetical protein OPKNFCMD_1174 [Methylobacterium crusticola]|uniref:Alpha/beta hydrolase n=1 Tax=Methylobacterium crusticola TaxID=1697972 RepID=A0ABQ4QU76_9HYPH|nr:hypothetical protein [Methylobacterium crusticola]GJD48455.1 hypothetical protein OPKNFCMD_1174 [Methylobacterium crusticola]
MPKMLILRGNHGYHADEAGKDFNYKGGALHEGPAKEYARRKGYEGVVLNISGDPPEKGKKRSHSPQTILALDTFSRDKSIEAFYGFSGGGFNIWWILQDLKNKKDEEGLKRIKLVVVLGAPDTPKSAYEASGYKPGSWELVYLTNPSRSDKIAPKDAELHMFGPEWLLSKTPDPGSAAP